MNIIRGSGETPAGRGSVRIELMDWSGACGEASRVRTEVFVHEQGVPLELEMDEWDPLSLHALALEAYGGPALGTARLLPDGHIGRMAVAARARRQGIGRALLDALLREAGARGHAQAILHAQTHAVGFYQRAGFVVSSAEFDEAGIAHVEMRRSLR